MSLDKVSDEQIVAERSDRRMNYCHTSGQHTKFVVPFLHTQTMQIIFLKSFYETLEKK